MPAGSVMLFLKKRILYPRKHPHPLLAGAPTLLSSAKRAASRASLPAVPLPDDGRPAPVRNRDSSGPFSPRLVPLASGRTPLPRPFPCGSILRKTASFQGLLVHVQPGPGLPARPALQGGAPGTSCPARSRRRDVFRSPITRTSRSFPTSRTTGSRDIRIVTDRRTSSFRLATA